MKPSEIEEWRVKYGRVVKSSATIKNVGEFKDTILMLAPTVHEVAAEAMRLMPRLLEEREMLLEALRAVEWGRLDTDHLGYCPSCGEWSQYNKHKIDCRSATAIRKAES